MKLTPFQYHNDEDLHGSYQYVPIQKVVQHFERISLDDDSILKHTRRSQILKSVKAGISDLSLNNLNEVKLMEIDVPENLRVTLPHDFVSFARLSVVVHDSLSNSYRLFPLDKNDNMHTAVAYLQDHNHEILFDHDGYVLKADAYNAQNIPYKRYVFHCGGDAKQYSRNGEYSITGKEIVFSSNLLDEPIVLEYFSDGLAYDTYGEEDIKVHKEVLPVLIDWVYNDLIQFKRNVSQSEKRRASNKLKSSLHKAKIKRAKFNLLEIARKARNSNY
ncbi:hypothetical protein SAMN04489761_4286 [Tenacibaculum sp. MAR_2009_124]|uniref:hypothetical protein n=1 Tax=Tenacibaculum sp. MAR_2009_124 TaxID=1250059 RepID=UPI00089AC185|nr:hypothetical protein [Tenacibaculum sp. MAR_2009_124]SED10417.1 hypothetical protein SAMN04489761_4286 [Tenacibaculum sp. MAR_2009_124]